MVKRVLQSIAILLILTTTGYLGCYYEVKAMDNDVVEVRKETKEQETEIEEPDIVEEVIEEEIQAIEVEQVVLTNEEIPTITEQAPCYLIETPYDERIVVENGLEFHYIAGDTFRGIMTVVSDPSRVFVGTPRDRYDGNPGANAGAIARRYDALYAVNGAFFVDTDYAGNGGTPIGFVFSEGIQKAGGSGQAFTLMGLDNNNNFILDVMTGKQAADLGIRDAVTCKPILVKDGAVTNLAGASTTLIDARTCIGATAQGYILFLTIDGRMSHSFGATTRDCADVMLAFGAVNAGNLDGGGSVSLCYNGETPISTSISSLLGSRASPEAFCIRRQ